MIKKLKQEISSIQEIVMVRFVVLILPFGIFSALLASRETPLRFASLFWIILAIITARNAGMLLDRYIDKDIDGKNPLTKERAIPQNRVSTISVLGIIVLNVAIMSISAYQLNPLCLYLSPVAFAFLAGYPYMKRFTFLSHFFLGAVLSLAPIGAWIAIRGDFGIVPTLLGLAVLCWVAGFDIMYHMEDVEFYAKENLYSIPRVLGLRKAKIICIALYAISVLFMACIGSVMSFGSVYFTGVACGATALAYQQYYFRDSKTLRRNKIFLIFNMTYSFFILTFTILEYMF